MIMLEFISKFRDCLPGRLITLDQGENVFVAGEDVVRVFILLSGQVHLVRYQEDGSVLTLNTVSEEAILAEASVYSQVYHCSALVTETAELFCVEALHVRDLLQSDAELAFRWSRFLAVALQNARMRSEILTMKTVSARLGAWLDWHGGELPEKGKWKLLASEIGVTPEALYREIGRLRKN